MSPSYLTNCVVCPVQATVPLPLPYLLRFGAPVLQVTDLVDASDGVHGHQADGHGDRSHDHLQGVRGHEQAVQPEKAGQHRHGNGAQRVT